MMKFCKPETLSIGAYVIQLTDNGARLCVAGSTDWPFWVSRHSSCGTTFPEPPVEGKFQTVILSMYQAKFHKQLASAIEYELRARRESQRPLEIQQKQQKETTVAYEQRDMSGALFRIDPEKRKSDAAPEFDGSIVIRGERFRLAGWVKTSKSWQKIFLPGGGACGRGEAGGVEARGQEAERGRRLCDPVLSADPSRSVSGVRLFSEGDDEPPCQRRRRI
jgi:hypothetical protein